MYYISIEMFISLSPTLTASVKADAYERKLHLIWLIVLLMPAERCISCSDLLNNP